MPFITRTLFLIAFFFIASAHSENGVKTIGIICYDDQRIDPWDPDSIKSGIPGSEEAVIYISEALATLGYQVIVFGKPPKDSPYSKEESNPKYVPANSHWGQKIDVAVIWRMPWKAKEYRQKARFVYYWPHDEPYGPQQTSDILAFDDVLWLSQWQRSAWICHNIAWAKFNHIFGNGIKPSQFSPVTEKANPHSCIYSSNYARGLDHLLDIWPKVREKYPDATLDIYYGWQTWGLITPAKEASMKKQIADYEVLGVKELGRVSHEAVNAAFAKCSLWSYPCSMPETFCITALRAQLSGTIPVIIESAALPETVASGYKCQRKDDYLPLLLKAMEEAEKTSLKQRCDMGTFVINNYTWEKMAQKWAELFEKNAKEKL